jgi:hypothetical protein
MATGGWIVKSNAARIPRVACCPLTTTQAQAHQPFNLKEPIIWLGKTILVGQFNTLQMEKKRRC